MKSEELSRLLAMDMRTITCDDIVDTAMNKLLIDRLLSTDFLKRTAIRKPSLQHSHALGPTGRGRKAKIIV